jgi:prepilin-type N-terminal cleavage/methylation domain-containing protein
MRIIRPRRLVRYSASRAFTLAEMLVVMGVIAVLAALVLPALATSKTMARSTICKNHLHEMGLALQMYVNENGNKYPYLRTAVEAIDSTSGWWFAKFRPYYPREWTNASYHCPGYRGINTGEDYPVHDPYGSYAYNALGARPPFGGFNGYAYPNESFGLGPTVYSFAASHPSTAEHQVRAPSEMLSIGESRFLSAEVNGMRGGWCETFCGWIVTNTPSARDAGSGPYQFAFDPDRHGKNYNQLCCDGHVAALSPWFLFNPINTASMWNYDHQPHPELWVPR